MIAGTVDSNLNAVVRIIVIGRNGQQQVIEAVIDTDFNGDLTLPYDVVSFLEFPWKRMQSVILGDGNPQICDVHSGEIDWNDEIRVIEIEVAETQLLVGMALLEGYNLHIEVFEGGKVSLQPL